MTSDDQVRGEVIRVTATTLESAERLALKQSPHELGGIMVGWWEGGIAAVVKALIPVPDHTAGWSYYERRHVPAQKALDEYLRSRDDLRCGYVGEWHSHPAPQPPSLTDRSSLRSIVRQNRVPVALVVLALTSEGGVTAHGLVGYPRWPRRTALLESAIERMPS